MKFSGESGGTLAAIVCHKPSYQPKVDFFSAASTTLAKYKTEETSVDVDVMQI